MEAQYDASMRPESTAELIEELEEFLADEADEVMNRKNFAATGSFLAEDRPRVLDYIGVDSQLMFNTFHNGRLYEWEHPDAEGRIERLRL